MPEVLAANAPRWAATQRGWWAAAIYITLLLLVFHQTTLSMVSTWLRDETFTHGFLILPISLWLLWDTRHTWVRMTPAPVPRVACLIVPLGILWLLAWLVDVQVVQQLMLVGMLIVGIWSILGHKLTKAWAFPLGFLFFAVPMGEPLIEPMMELTATSTVWLVKLTGIPVYREGMYFTLPTGSWSVIQACSGVRYLIASLTLGVLFARLTYTSPWRRVAFVLASIIVPILANSLRAYIIVMLGHLSDMKIATGVDHLIYGWVFFGIVMLLLFWVGSFFREDLTPDKADLEPAPVGEGHGSAAVRLLPTTLLVLVLAAIWPAWSMTVENTLAPFDEKRFELAVPAGGWQTLDVSVWNWVPVSAVSGQLVHYMGNEENVVALFIQYPLAASSEEDVVGSIGRFTQRGSGWRVSEQVTQAVELSGSTLTVEDAVVGGDNNGQYLAWSWYRIGARHTGSDYMAKVLETLGRLGVRPTGSFRLVAVTPIVEDRDEARQALRKFLAASLEGIEQGLDRAGGQD